MLDNFLIDKHVLAALEEDIGFGDITTDNLVKEGDFLIAKLNTRSDGILCGTKVFERVFKLLSEKVNITFYKKDGDKIQAGDTVALIDGPADAVLKGERTALNYIQRMSGIATETKKYQDKIGDYKAKISDTRKTTPNFRIFEKYSVFIGGACIHRFNLADCSMIKDRKKRTETAYSIVRVMGDIINSKDQSDAKSRNNDDFWHKLWDHLHIMSDYSLDVDSPFPKPEKDFSMKNVEKPSYNTRNNIRFRTYGINMQHLIEKVSSYPEEVRKEYAPILANHLKMMYLSYNRNSVNDILIRHQISELSDGRIEIPEDFDFTTTKELLNTASQNSAPQPAPGKKKKKKKKKKAAAV